MAALLQVAAPMRRQHAFYSQWCALFDFHLKRLRWSASFFAQRTGRSQQAVHAYLVGRARPPLDQVPVWAAMLGLRGEERERFITAAQEAHVPPGVWKRLHELEKRVAAAQPATPAEAENRLRLAEAVIAELVELLRDIEAVFFARTVPVHQVAAMRAKTEAATRRAIERYARPRPDASGNSPPPA